MAATGRIGISGVDTRALTRLVRREGPPTIAIAHNAKGKFDLEALQQMAAEWPGLEGMDLAKEVSRDQLEAWSGGKWELGEGYRLGGNDMSQPHVVAIDYGAKRNIFRNLVEAGARVTVLAGDRRVRRGDEPRARRLLPVQRPGRSGGDRRICDAGDPADARQREALVRHLPRPPVAGAGGRRQDGQDVPGPPRRQPSGQAAGGRRGRDHQHEPRLRGRARRPARPMSAKPMSACSTTAIAASS